MGKNAAKFGYKSGTLPVVRSILKKPIKPVVRPANPNTGYAEGVQHPRGTSREQPLPETKTVHQLIQETAKEPKIIPDLKKLTEAQKEKARKAALRREYYIESLKAEEKKVELTEKREQRRKELDEQRRNERVHEVSEATKLTLPTISSLLDGPLMRPRTAEEEEILHAKRRANRLNNQLTGEVNRATNLLELYYEASNFIVDEEGLAAAIDKEFREREGPMLSYNPESKVRDYNDVLNNALFGEIGEINKNPGLISVEEHLSGERIEFEEKLHAAKNKVHENEINNVRNGA